MKYNLNEIEGLGTWPGFERRMHLYVFHDGILVEPENCSDDKTDSVEGELGTRLQLLVEVLVVPLIDFRDNNTNGLVNEETKVPTQLADYEEEVYEKDQYIQPLENERVRLKVTTSHSSEESTQR